MTTVSILQFETRRFRRAGFTLLEALVALVVVAALLAILLPALQAARHAARVDRCAMNQHSIGSAWQLHIRDHGEFPEISGPDKGWAYGGVEFSRVNGSPMLDYARPLNRYVSSRWEESDGSIIFRSPLDKGIEDPEGVGGTHGRSAFRTYGTSYLANELLLDASRAGLAHEPRPLLRSEVTTEPARLLIMGAPVWRERVYDTGLRADWYGERGAGNALFLDGSVRYLHFPIGRPNGTEFSVHPVSAASDGATIE